MARHTRVVLLGQDRLKSRNDADELSRRVESLLNGRNLVIERLRELNWWNCAHQIVAFPAMLMGRLEIYPNWQIEALRQSLILVHELKRHLVGGNLPPKRLFCR